MTPLRALCTRSVLVLTTIPSPQGMAQAATGFGARSISTRHMRQFAGTLRRSW